MKPQLIHLRIARLSLDATAAAGTDTARNPLRAADGIAAMLRGGASPARDMDAGWQRAVGEAVSRRLIDMGILTPEPLKAAAAEGRKES